MKKPPTLIDVGREAGVSAITVSRALRTPDMVSDSLRAKVAAAVEKLGYVPDTAASSLASRRSNIIGMIVPSFSNIVFADVLAGAYDAVDGTRFSIQIGNVQYSALAEEKLMPHFIKLKPAGLIISGTDQTSKTTDLLRDVPFPVVQIMDVSSDPIDMIVGFSNYRAMSEAVGHMIEQGFRKIGFIGGQMDPRSQQRLAGYKSTMEKHGLFDPNMISTTTKPSSVELGRHLFADLLQKAPGCDAVVSNNDDLAVGVLFECQRRNIRVPHDMGICGFNDLGTTSQTFPPISSVHTPRFGIGSKAVELIIAALENESRNPQKTFDLGFELRVRASTRHSG